MILICIIVDSNQSTGNITRDKQLFWNKNHLIPKWHKLQEPK